MPEPARNPKVDAFLGRETRWREEFERLRTIILGCGLVEELKWGVPCYALEGRNVVLMHGFKDYCAILFVKGALLKDPNGVLIQQTENVQAARQIRFRNVGEIAQLKPVVTAYVEEAIELEKSGAKVRKKDTTDFPMATEFKDRLDADATLRAKFAALTPGRQRGYLLHFAAPKLAKTRDSRIENSIPRILDGKGLDD